jgi:hypothetical protein
VVVDDDHPRNSELLVGQFGFVGDNAADRLVVRPITQESENGVAGLGGKRGAVRPESGPKFTSRHSCAAGACQSFPELGTEVNGVDCHLLRLSEAPKGAGRRRRIGQG